MSEQVDDIDETGPPCGHVPACFPDARRSDYQPPVLSFEDITARSGQRWTHDPEHGQEMFDVLVLGVERVVVPTRMHEPGWYIRTRDDNPVYENERDPAVLRQWCDDRLVTADESGRDNPVS